MKKILLAVLVLAIAGFAGVLLGTTPAAEYVRNPFYRDALAIEKEFPMIDVVGFSSKDNQISIGVVFLGNMDRDEADRLTRWLNYVAQRRLTPQTEGLDVWALAVVRGRISASGLWQVSGDALRSEGVVNETMMANEMVYYRWIMGEPFMFEEGVWPWVGR